MYFWNVNELAQRLKENTLSGYEEMQQYIAFMLFSTLGTQIQRFFPNNSLFQTYPQYFTTSVKLCLIIISSAILIGEIIYCHTINKTGDNKDFVKRMICLAFPISMRLLLFGLLTFVPIFLIFSAAAIEILAAKTMQAQQAIMLVVLIVCYAIWIPFTYWYAGKQIRKIAH